VSAETMEDQSTAPELLSTWSAAASRHSLPAVTASAETRYPPPQLGVSWHSHPLCSACTAYMGRQTVYITYYTGYY
jgi:hypothetical protein